MININIDISNTLIGSYSLNAIYSKVQIIFSGIPEEWQGNRIYATFVQDNLDPTVEVIDNVVSVPSEILKTGTDFYVSVYAIAYGSSQVSEPSSPILITVDTTKSSDINVEELIKTIMQHNATIRSLSEVALTGSYNSLKDTPSFANLATEKYVNEKFKISGGVGKWSLTSRIDGVSAGFKILFLYPVDFTAWHVYLEGKDISGALPPNKMFTTAPLIFNDLSKITITLDNNGTELLSMRMNNVIKNDNIQIGNLLVKED